jgi:hypothetical protein
MSDGSDTPRTDKSDLSLEGLSEMEAGTSQVLMYHVGWLLNETCKLHEAPWSEGQTHTEVWRSEVQVWNISKSLLVSSKWLITHIELLQIELSIRYLQISYMIIPIFIDCKPPKCIFGNLYIKSVSKVYSDGCFRNAHFKGYPMVYSICPRSKVVVPQFFWAPKFFWDHAKKILALGRPPYGIWSPAIWKVASGHLESGKCHIRKCASRNGDYEKTP